MEYIWDKLWWWWCLWQSVRTNNFWNGKWSLFFARALADFVNNKEMNTERGKLFKRPEKSPPTNSPGMDVSPFPGMGRENCGIINEILTLREENNRNSHCSRHFFDWQVAPSPLVPYSLNSHCHLNNYLKSPTRYYWIYCLGTGGPAALKIFKVRNSCPFVIKKEDIASTEKCCSLFSECYTISLEINF